MSKPMRTTIIIISILLVIVLVVSLVLQHPAFGRRQDSETRRIIEASPQFRDGRFQNQIPTPQYTGNTNFFSALWEFLFSGDTNKVPREAIPAVKTVLQTLPTDRDWLVWFGHSSYLFQLGGKRFLVDPVLKMEFPAKLMMTPFKGTDIYLPDDMPTIDYLIITHEHWDHLDYATVRDLREKVAHAICPLGIRNYLEYWGYPATAITEMDWNDSCQINDGIITCLPSRHFSNRLFRQNQTLWASFMVEVAGRKVYIGGDGGYDNRFKTIGEQFAPICLAMMENGQYNKDWANIHLMPDDLEQAIIDLNAEQVFTVHHDKFALAKHAWTEPDSVANQIASKHHLNILDSPIGTVIYF